MKEPVLTIQSHVTLLWWFLYCTKQSQLPYSLEATVQPCFEQVLSKVSVQLVVWQAPGAL
jgi:hypothetical protein